MVLVNIIQENDLRLRPARIADATLALPWYSDPEVLKGSEAVAEPYEIETVERMYRYLIDNGELYVIELSENGIWVPIGDVCLMKNSTPIVIGSKDYRSKGIGKRVLSLLVRRAKELGWKEMNVKAVYSYNTRSLKLFKSFGFRETKRTERNDGIVEISMKLDLFH